MTTMNKELYTALITAKVPEEEAQAAAIAVVERDYLESMLEAKLQKYFIRISVVVVATASAFKLLP